MGFLGTRYFWPTAKWPYQPSEDVPGSFLGFQKVNPRYVGGCYCSSLVYHLFVLFRNLISMQPLQCMLSIPISDFHQPHLEPPRHFSNVTNEVWTLQNWTKTIQSLLEYYQHLNWNTIKKRIEPHTGIWENPPVSQNPPRHTYIFHHTNQTTNRKRSKTTQLEVAGVTRNAFEAVEAVSNVFSFC